LSETADQGRLRGGIGEVVGECPFLAGQKMSAESTLAMGSFLATRAFAALIISVFGGLFVKIFAKILLYSSSYLVFFWAFSRTSALAIVVFF
jgi:hypothetical protein